MKLLRKKTYEIMSQIKVKFVLFWSKYSFAFVWKCLSVFNFAVVFCNRDDLSGLKYLSMCIKESLRLHSPVPFVERQTTKDMDINGHFLPAGTVVDIELYVLHHNPAVWDDPMVCKIIDDSMVCKIMDDSMVWQIIDDSMVWQIIDDSMVWQIRYTRYTR